MNLNDKIIFYVIRNMGMAPVFGDEVIRLVRYQLRIYFLPEHWCYIIYHYVRTSGFQNSSASIP